MNNNKVWVVVMVVLAVAVCADSHAQSAKSKASLEEAKKAIAESNRIYFTAFAKGDSTIFINRYAKDCCILAPNGPALCGATAPGTFYKIAYNDIGLRNGKFITTAVYGDGEEYVTEEGLWQSYDGTGSYLTMVSFWCYGRRHPKDGRCSGIPLAVTVNKLMTRTIVG